MVSMVRVDQGGLKETWPSRDGVHCDKGRQFQAPKMGT